MEKKLLVEEHKNETTTESVIGPSVKIDGDLKSHGSLRVDGVVTGKIKTAQNLFIGESANISADIEAENSIINGTIQGNVKISGALVLGRTSKITGDIFCGSLQVQEGAYFAGKCQMRENTNILPVEDEK